MKSNFPALIMAAAQLLLEEIVEVMRIENHTLLYTAILAYRLIHILGVHYNI